MQKDSFIEKLDSICPLETQEEWDNSGVQIDMGDPEVSKVLVALEITDDVITEAMDTGCGMIVTHHPLLFGFPGSIRSDDPQGRYIERLVRAGISVYSSHTPFDKMDGGNNDNFGKILGIRDIEKVSANDFVRKGRIEPATYFGDLIKDFSEKLGIDLRLFRAVGDPEVKVETVCWCTGSGAEFIRDAFDEGADLYITGDLKYHDAQLAKALGLLVLDCGHYGSEKDFVQAMADIIEKETDVACVRSKIDINPFSW